MGDKTRSRSSLPPACGSASPDGSSGSPHVWNGSTGPGRRSPTGVTARSWSPQPRSHACERRSPARDRAPTHVVVSGSRGDFQTVGCVGAGSCPPIRAHARGSGRSRSIGADGKEFGPISSVKPRAPQPKATRPAIASGNPRPRRERVPGPVERSSTASMGSGRVIVFARAEHVVLTASSSKTWVARREPPQA